MPDMIQIECEQSDIVQIVDDVFSEMLGLQVQGCSQPPPEGQSALTAAVHFAGSWKGAVLVQCTLQQAMGFTARMTGGPAPTAMNEDVRDVMGELANMVGGNLKSVLHPGVALSMPSVVEGTDYLVSICGGNAKKTAVLSCQLGVFRVTVVQLLDKKIGTELTKLN